MSKQEGIGTETFLRKLEAKVLKMGGPTAAAKEWNTYQQHISSAIRGSILPTKAILKGMGYEVANKKIIYRYKPTVGER